MKTSNFAGALFAGVVLGALSTFAQAADKPDVMVMLSPGFEEDETVEIIDVVRRGGFDVDVVSIAGQYVPGSHDIVLKADRALPMDQKKALEAFSDYNMIVIPAAGRAWTTSLRTTASSSS